MTRPVDLRGFVDAHAVPRAARRATQARLLRGLAGASQVAVMGALFVLWKHFHVPFWTAAERCFVVGLGIYTVLGTLAAMLLALARLEPVAAVVGYLSRFASVVVYAVLRYVHGEGVIKSAATWAVLYVAASLIVRRIERRAARRLDF
jgi:hypothetical protein